MKKNEVFFKEGISPKTGFSRKILSVAA